jgi:hypothetical protein
VGASLTAPVQQLTGRLGIGVDIGQKIDYSCLAVAQQVRVRVPPPPAQAGVYESGADLPAATAYDLYRFPWLERLPLGLSFNAIVDRLAATVAAVRAQATPTTLPILLDATGVGAPLLEWARAALPREQVIGATFTHGDKVEQVGRELRVGKAALVARLKVDIARGRVQFPAASPEAAGLVAELEHYELHIDPLGHEKYGAFATGAHDDMATAVGLALLAVNLPSRRFIAW